MIKLDHLTISVRDYRRSRDWYIETLGLKQEFEVPDFAAALQDEAGFTLFVEQTSAAVKPSCVLTFQVDDVDAKYRQLAASNVNFVHPPSKLFWGYGAELDDIDGYRIRLWDEKSMRSKG